jgi:hypothetical protein
VQFYAPEPEGLQDSARGFNLVSTPYVFSVISQSSSSSSSSFVLGRFRVAGTSESPAGCLKPGSTD